MWAKLKELMQMTKRRDIGSAEHVLRTWALIVSLPVAEDISRSFRCLDVFRWETSCQCVSVQGGDVLETHFESKD